MLKTAALLGEDKLFFNRYFYYFVHMGLVATSKKGFSMAATAGSRGGLKSGFLIRNKGRSRTDFSKLSRFIFASRAAEKCVVLLLSSINSGSVEMQRRNYASGPFLG